MEINGVDVYSTDVGVLVYIEGNCEKYGKEPGLISYPQLFDMYTQCAEKKSNNDPLKQGV